ncbi:AhpC-TSA-domain-containing protein [Schizopora paradoxa]|uniref:thioredoxin-dependent peroxiredoxin n=1 Tax=Schizopora paradoxa TaxID=27342 RepID=A0A0H2RK08_9AGAM|nr:AhpC-TSA-domain-containing protein [Schizopora paradoxa]
MAGVAESDTSAPRRSGRNHASSNTTSAQPKKTETKKRKAADDSGVAVTKGKKAKPSTDADVEEETEGVKAVELGGPLPDITVQNEKGEDVRVQELTKEKGVVIFLVPKADTPGCTTQACGFRDIYSEFEKHDFDVYCLSADSSTAQTKWQGKKSLPYSLLSDPKRELVQALGAGKNNKTARSHFVFGKDEEGKAGGKLLDKKMPVKPVDSPKLALEFIEKIEERL